MPGLGKFVATDGVHRFRVATVSSEHPKSAPLRKFFRPTCAPRNPFPRNALQPPPELCLQAIACRNNFVDIVSATITIEFVLTMVASTPGQQAG